MTIRFRVVMLVVLAAASTLTVGRGGLTAQSAPAQQTPAPAYTSKVMVYDLNNKTSHVVYRS